MNAATRRLVRRRAADRCEYCRLPQRAVDFTFHIEHVVARQHGGADDASNLALACDRCNLYKGPNLAAIDPDSGRVVRIFHPRTDAWDDHFEIAGAAIVGRTPAGRATVGLLRMNAVARLRLRAALRTAGDF